MRGAAQRLSLLLEGPLRSRLASWLFSGPPVPRAENRSPPTSHASGTLFCRRGWSAAAPA